MHDRAGGSGLGRDAMASLAMPQAITMSGTTDGHVRIHVGADGVLLVGVSAMTLRRVVDDVADVGTTLVGPVSG